MMARKPGSRSSLLARASAAGGLLIPCNGCNPKLTSAPSIATATISQIRLSTGMRSTTRPQPIAPTMNAPEPHSRSGP